MPSVLRESSVVGGIPLLLVSGSFDDVVGVLDREVADKSQLVLFQVNPSSVHADARMLVIDGAFVGDVERAKAQIPNHELDRRLGGVFHTITFLASLEDVRYASASASILRSGGGLDHGMILRKLAANVFDELGRVKGSPSGATTLFLYSHRLTPRADFAWIGHQFRRVPFDLGRETVRHTVVGRSIVMVATAGDNRLVAAASHDIAAYVRGGSVDPFRSRFELVGRITDLSLGVKARGNAYKVIVTTDAAYIPLTVAIRDGSVSVFPDFEAQVALDGSVRDLGGAVKLAGDHAVFFGQSAVRFVRYVDLRPPFDAFFRSHAPTA